MTRQHTNVVDLVSLGRCYPRKVHRQQDRHRSAAPGSPCGMTLTREEASHEGLYQRRIDTTVIVGCSTSGCLRATSTDAHDQNFRVMVPREVGGDRSESAHMANLFNIDARFSDVTQLDAVIDEFDRHAIRDDLSPNGELRS